MKILALLLACMVSAGAAFAQPAWKRDKPRAMREEDRQRMREDMRDAYRDRRERPAPARQMTPEERDKLRRDIENANRDLRRK